VVFGNKPPQEFFDELERVSKAQILWGANNFGYEFKGFIAWDKMVRGSDRYSQVELASLSKNLSTVSKYVQIKTQAKDKIHPTQKPIALYSWILNTYGGGYFKGVRPNDGKSVKQNCRIQVGF